MGAINIVVDLKVAPGKEEAFLQGVTAFGTHVLREEAGCLRFEVLRAHDDRGAVVPRRFIVNELYADLDARRRHGSSAEAKRLFGEIMPLMSGERVITALRLNHDPGDLRRLITGTDTMAERTIIGEFETIDGAEEEFTRIMLDHARHTLDEERGCLRFQVTKPVDHEGAPLANRLVLNELFASQAAIDRHQAGPRMQPMIASIKPLLDTMHLTIASTVTGRLANKA